MRTIRNNIIVGLILITPIVVTVLVGTWLFRFVTDVAFMFFPKGLRQDYPLIFSRVTALIAVVVLLFLIGLLARNFVGKRLYQLGDAVLRRVPVLNKIYISVRQISEALLDQSQYLFKEVVLVEYPRKGLYMLGFITSNVPHSILPGFEKRPLEEFVSVFIPTSPNPTSGFVVFAPRSDIMILSLSVADAMKLVVSGGAVFPGTSLPDDRPTLLDKLEEWVRRDRSAEEARDAKTLS
jgi:uncharacterized membrane protein